MRHLKKFDLFPINEGLENLMKLFQKVGRKVAATSSDDLAKVKSNLNLKNISDDAAKLLDNFCSKLIPGKNMIQDPDGWKLISKSGGTFKLSTLVDIIELIGQGKLSPEDLSIIEKNLPRELVDGTKVRSLFVGGESIFKSANQTAKSAELAKTSSKAYNPVKPVNSPPKPVIDFLNRIHTYSAGKGSRNPESLGVIQNIFKNNFGDQIKDRFDNYFTKIDDFINVENSIWSIQSDSGNKLLMSAFEKELTDLIMASQNGGYAKQSPEFMKALARFKSILPRKIKGTNIEFRQDIMDILGGKNPQILN